MDMSELIWENKRSLDSIQYYPARLKERYGEEREGWINKIFWGDNLHVMTNLLREFKGKIKLIYIDPPFDSKADYKKEIKLKCNRGKESFEEKQYTDIWGSGRYLQFMYERLLLMKDLLSDEGVIYLHCDWHKVHELRCLLDEVFGRENFRNEIIWSYGGRGAKAISSQLPRNHDNILVYAKSDRQCIKKVYIKKYLKPEEYKIDEQGNYFYTSPRGDYTDQSIEELKKINRVYITKNGTVRIKYFLDKDKKGVYKTSLIGDVWDDIPDMMHSKSAERLGYPTQKPARLIERIIEMSTDKDDIIFDCFMGSGTTFETAVYLERKFIGADINLCAIQTSANRVIKGKYKGGQFEIYNIHHCEIFKNPLEAKKLILENLGIQRHNKNNIFDGEKNGRMVKIMPMNKVASGEDLKDIIDYLRIKKSEKQRIESLTLVCTGYDPELKNTIINNLMYEVDVEIVDLLKDSIKLKKRADVDISIQDNKLVINKFNEENLLERLKCSNDKINDWKSYVESVAIDWNYNGEFLQPQIVDIPEKNEFVKGIYNMPEHVSKIRVKIIDILFEALEVELDCNQEIDNTIEGCIL